MRSMTKTNAFTIPRQSQIARELEKNRRAAKEPTRAQQFFIPPAHSFHATQKLMKASI